jgi:hypothetical protein
MFRAMSMTTALSASSSVTTPRSGAARSPATIPVSAMDSAWTMLHSHRRLTMSGLEARRAGYLSQQLTTAWARPVAAGKSQMSR